MIKFFKHKTKNVEAKNVEAVAERSAAAPTPEPVPDSPTTPTVAETSSAAPAPEPVPDSPTAPTVTDATFWSGASMDDGLIRIEEKWHEGALVVRADLPGIDPEQDVQLTVVNGRLVIRAERHQQDTIERDGYVLKEQRYGLFTRALPLRDGVDASMIIGTYKDGVLEVRIPMPVQASPQPPTRIPITT